MEDSIFIHGKVVDKLLRYMKSSFTKRYCAPAEKLLTATSNFGSGMTRTPRGLF